MLYEFRRVTVGPSKMGSYVAFARDHLASAHERHGIEAVGYFNVILGAGMADQFPYLLRWRSWAERQEKLARLSSDATLAEAREAADQDGPLVVDVANELWESAPYRELLERDWDTPGLYEYRISQTLPNKKPVVHWRNEEWVSKIYTDLDMQYVIACDALVGHSSYVHYLMRWTSVEERNEKWAAFFQDPRWQQVSRDTGPLTFRVPNELWKPTSFSPILT